MFETQDFSAIKLKLASPDEILSWSHGEVLKPETINYRTFRSEKDGLFCERIFGPTKDFECYCGKYKRVRYKGVVCDKCGVEVTNSRVRRERLGHIKLASPCAHVWFFKGVSSKLSILFDISPRDLESVIYFSSYIVTNIDEDKKAEVISKISQEFLEKREDAKKAIEEKIKLIEDRTKEEISALQIVDKVQQEIAKEEIELKARKEIAAFWEEISESEEKLKDEEGMGLLKIGKIKKMSVVFDRDYEELKNLVDEFAELDTGAEAIVKILEKIDFNETIKNLRKEIRKVKGQSLLRLTRRLKTIEGFIQSKVEPESMILRIIPVIPPDLRPMVQLQGGRFATSDLNDLYRRVINRNNRLKKLLSLGAPEVITKNEKRMLQEAVDALLDSSRSTARPFRGRQALRSLSDMLRGKQGRFRQNLLGKRVDYSGRSVIVVGPQLQLSQCGLPKEMALELFKPFVLREIMLRGLAPNVKSARNVLEERGKEVWDILEEFIKDRPVLLNRAPTLHRLGIQGFYPILIEGNAIQLHPCVCAGFNADFDGDQMAVHVPLSANSRREVHETMLATKNLLKPADGNPITVPSYEMLLGLYYITTVDTRMSLLESVFSSAEEVFLALDKKQIALRQPIKVSLNSEILETTAGKIILNEVLPPPLRFYNEALTKENRGVRKLVERCFLLEGRERTVELIDNLKDLGFKYAMISGISMAVKDCKVPENKQELLDQAENKVSEIESNFKRGLITQEEKQRLNQHIWTDLVDELDRESWLNLDEHNPLKILINSGCKGSRQQVKQMVGMRGLIVDPSGRIVELPIRSCYKEGLTGLEYFTGARGARKGLVDIALKTADAGYLTRRLVDVAQDVLVRREDCDTDEGIEIKRSEKTMLAGFSERILGRFLVANVKDGKKTIAKKGDLINEDLQEIIVNSGVTSVFVRSPLKCKTQFGICAKCYGQDLGTRELIKIGTPAGIIAAQSIGEPGTQLTLKTKHLGALAGAEDVTEGLLRVEEVFETRTPKFEAIMAEINGRVSIIENKDERKIVITDKNTKELNIEEHKISPMIDILVSNGDYVTAGTALTSGPLNPKKLLQKAGITATQKYLLDEIQKVYSSQGVLLNDKHIEVIIRQMFSKVKIKDSGDTDLLVNDIVSRFGIKKENEKAHKDGKNPAKAEDIVLGITKASLITDSFLAAASFQNTTSILTDAAVSGKIDKLLGLKENVIIGRLIPVGERARLDHKNIKS